MSSIFALIGAGGENRLPAPRQTGESAPREGSFEAFLQAARENPDPPASASFAALVALPSPEKGAATETLVDGDLPAPLREGWEAEDVTLDTLQWFLPAVTAPSAPSVPAGEEGLEALVCGDAEMEGSAEEGDVAPVAENGFAAVAVVLETGADTGKTSVPEMETVESERLGQAVALSAGPQNTTPLPAPFVRRSEASGVPENRAVLDKKASTTRSEENAALTAEEAQLRMGSAGTRSESPGPVPAIFDEDSPMAQAAGSETAKITGSKDVPSAPLGETPEKNGTAPTPVLRPAVMRNPDGGSEEIVPASREEVIIPENPLALNEGPAGDSAPQNAIPSSSETGREVPPKERPVAARKDAATAISPETSLLRTLEPSPPVPDRGAGESDGAWRDAPPSVSGSSRKMPGTGLHDPLRVSAEVSPSGIQPAAVAPAPSAEDTNTDEATGSDAADRPRNDLPASASQETRAEDQTPNASAPQTDALLEPTRQESPAFARISADTGTGRTPPAQTRKEPATATAARAEGPSPEKESIRVDAGYRAEEHPPALEAEGSPERTTPVGGEMVGPVPEQTDPTTLSGPLSGTPRSRPVPGEAVTVKANPQTEPTALNSLTNPDASSEDIPQAASPETALLSPSGEPGNADAAVLEAAGVPEPDGGISVPRPRVRAERVVRTDGAARAAGVATETPDALKDASPTEVSAGEKREIHAREEEPVGKTSRLDVSAGKESASPPSDHAGHPAILPEPPVTRGPHESGPDASAVHRQTVAPATEAVSGASATSGDARTPASLTFSTLPTLTDDPAESRAVVNQVLRGARFLLQDNVSEVRVRLEPPELGSVHIRLTSGKESLSGEITVSSHDVKGIVEANLHQLRSSLNDQGLQVGHIDVSVRGDQGNGRGFDTSGEFRQSGNTPDQRQNTEQQGNRNGSRQEDQRPRHSRNLVDYFA